MTYTITVDMDEHCVRCGKAGVVSTPDGGCNLCMRCIRKRLECSLRMSVPSRKRTRRAGGDAGKRHA